MAYKKLLHNYLIDNIYKVKNKDLFVLVNIFCVLYLGSRFLSFYIKKKISFNSITIF